jgi:hypothetical protein
MTEKMAEIEERALARLMVPDALTPGQYYEGVRRDDPATGAIKRLMLAVLEDALRCLKTYAKVRTPIRRRMFVEAQAWIPTVRLADRSRLRPFARLFESNPIACATAYANGVCDYPAG